MLSEAASLRFIQCVRIRIGLFFLFWAFFISGLSAQVTSPGSVPKSPEAKSDTGWNSNLTALPSISYTPETSLAFGGVGLWTFQFPGEADSTKTSRITLGGSYTLNGQILSFMPFQLYFNNEKYALRGKAGFFRFFYYYYGIGNRVSESNEEAYDATFPSLRMTFRRRIGKHFFIGPLIDLSHYEHSGFDPKGELRKGHIPGSNGSTISGLGGVITYDTRRNNFFPEKGFFAEGSVLRNKEGTFGTRFDFTRYKLDIRKYVDLGERTVLALNGYGEFIDGTAPFNELSMLGGDDVMRGYYSGRYRDKHYLALQAEFRDMFFGPFGYAVFTGLGKVFPSFDALDTKNLKPSIGFGLRLRINRSEHINVRMDQAFGTNGSTGFYGTMGEAF